MRTTENTEEMWREHRKLKLHKTAVLKEGGKTYAHSRGCDAKGSNARVYYFTPDLFEGSSSQSSQTTSLDDGFPRKIVLKVCPINNRTNDAYRDMLLMTHTNHPIWKKTFPKLLDVELDPVLAQALTEDGKVWWFETFEGYSILDWSKRNEKKRKQLQNNFEGIVEQIKRMQKELEASRIWVRDFNLGNITWDDVTDTVHLVDPKIESVLCATRLAPILSQMLQVLRGLIPEMSEPSLSQQILTEKFPDEARIEFGGPLSPRDELPEENYFTPKKKKKKQEVPNAPKRKKKQEDVRETLEKLQLNEQSEEFEPEEGGEQIPDEDDHLWVDEPSAAQVVTVESIVQPINEWLQKQTETRVEQNLGPKPKAKYNRDQICDILFYLECGERVSGTVREVEDWQGMWKEQNFTDMFKCLLKSHGREFNTQLEGLGHWFDWLTNRIDEIQHFRTCFDEFMFALIDRLTETEVEKQERFGIWWNRQKIRSEPYDAHAHKKTKEQYIRNGGLMIWLNTNRRGEIHFQRYICLSINGKGHLWSSIQALDRIFTYEDACRPTGQVLATETTWSELIGQ